MKPYGQSGGFPSMMRKYVAAYVLWLTAVLGMAAVAVTWYKKVEEIGYRELADRLRNATEATEATEAEE
jgi:phosphatidylserine decarboxylase